MSGISKEMARISGIRASLVSRKLGCLLLNERWLAERGYCPAQKSRNNN